MDDTYMTEREQFMMDSIELFSRTGDLTLELQMYGFNHTALCEQVSLSLQR